MRDIDSPRESNFTELPFVCTLVCMGHKYTRVDVNKTGWVFFAFPDPNGKLKTLRQDFEDDKLRVNPREFYRRFKELRARVDEEKRAYTGSGLNHSDKGYWP